MAGVVFELSSDESDTRVEWSEARRGRQRAWDWELLRDAIVVQALDTYSGTASLGELEPGSYVLRIQPKFEDGPPDDSHELHFTVTRSGRVIEQVELAVGVLVDELGTVLQFHEQLVRRLLRALDDLGDAQRKIAALEAHIDILKGLGDLPKEAPRRSLWLRLGSSSVAAVIAICAVAGGAVGTIHGADIQATATRDAAEVQAEATRAAARIQARVTRQEAASDDERLQAALDQCMTTSAALSEQLHSTVGAPGDGSDHHP